MLNPIFIIIGINVFIFIAANISSTLVYDLALWAPLQLTLQQPWGVFTSMFTHVSFTHILFNMLALYFFGSYLLKITGLKKFLIIYIGGGLLGSIFYVLLSTLISPDIPGLAIGASGAIFALGGTLAVLMPKMKVYIMFIPVPVPLWIAVIGGGLIMSFMPNVAWEAHLGGLLFGLGAGFIIKNQQKQTYYY
ncbi:MAG: rhomboid family intramembrane serine protease [Dehalococcoidales bacterium]|nr:rhomboid family intramembrane serine protease [Dehalococcoidales bacterium]